MSERDEFRIDTDPEFRAPTPIGDRENDKQPKYCNPFFGIENQGRYRCQSKLPPVKTSVYVSAVPVVHYWLITFFKQIRFHGSYIPSVSNFKLYCRRILSVAAYSSGNPCRHFGNPHGKNGISEFRSFPG